MKLVYMWIDKYRENKDGYLLDSLGFNFHHKYRFEYDGKNKLTFSILEESQYIDSYYESNQYYSMIVGKNGSGKSSIFNLLYNGVNISLNMKTKKENIENMFIAIFLYDDKFLFYGFKINKKNEVNIDKLKKRNEINLDIKYRDYIDNLKILCVNADFGKLETINTHNEISKERMKISDDTKKREANIFLLNRQQQNVNNPLNILGVYESTLNYYKNDFIQDLLLNYKYFKSIEDKDVELPRYIYFKFDVPPKNYYEVNFNKLIKNHSEETKDFIIELSQALYKYYDLIVFSSSLSVFQKIEAFYIFYLVDKYLFYASEATVFIDTLKKVNIIYNIRNINFDNIDIIYTNNSTNIYFNPFGEFLILRDITIALQNTHYKVIDNNIIIDRFENENDLRHLTMSVDSFKQIFTLAQIYLSYDFYPILSSGHLQLIKIFNYILEGINKFIKDGDSYDKYVLLLIDEPDANLHYEWQRNFIKWLSKFLKQFKDFNFHIIINTHSGIMLSDIPKENVIVLDRRNNKTIIKEITSQTLAQNLLENLNNDFFLDKFIGGYIEDKILEILNQKTLNNNEKELISNLGEKILRISLEMKYDIRSEQ